MILLSIDNIGHLTPQPFEIDRFVAALHIHGFQAILAVLELHDLLPRIADCTVLLDHQVFQRFDQTALHLTSIRCFDGRVDQTHSTRHRVEKKLETGQAREKRVLDEALGLGRLAVLEEVRERARLEGVGDAHAVERLLRDAADHLAHVDVRALAAADVHLQRHVVLADRELDGLAHLVAHRGERAVQLGLQRLLHVAAGLALQRRVAKLADELLALLLLRSQHLGLGLDHHRGRRHVADADREAHVAHEPAREPRGPVHRPHPGFQTVVPHQRKDDALLRPVAQASLAHPPAYQNRVLDVQLSVQRIEPFQVKSFVV